jgi:antitoxin VapB
VIILDPNVLSALTRGTAVEASGGRCREGGPIDWHTSSNNEYCRRIRPAPDVAMNITSVFIHNRSQAVCLPADVRLPESVKKVRVRARGVDRIISPAGHSWDEFFLSGPVASDDFMAERAAKHQADREAL